MNHLYILLADQATNTSSSTDKMTESLKNIVKSPIFYIVIGAIVLLIIAIYLLRRVVKPSKNVTKVVTRRGKIYKLINENDQKYFLRPFKDSLSASFSLDEKELSSDQLFINNGPDALYKVNFTLKYKIENIEGFYPYRDNASKLMISKINEELREYADNGHALDIVKDYRSNNSKILSLINKAVEQYCVNVTAFKVNYIEPLGKK